jgi:hypothetical protein
VFFDVPTWAAIASAIAAWVAALLAYSGARASKRALIIVERQEQRRQPVLVPYLVEGYVRFVDDGQRFRLYAFLLSISNPSDADNGIAQLDLHVTYTTAKGLRMTLKVPANAIFAAAFIGSDSRSLSVPIRIDAHQTIAGWNYFRIDESLLESASIDGYTLVATDSHGYQVSVEPIIGREFSNEMETQKGSDTSPN